MGRLQREQRGTGCRLKREEAGCRLKREETKKRKACVTGRNRKTPEEIASEKLFVGDRTAKKLLLKKQAIGARNLMQRAYN